MIPLDLTRCTNDANRPSMDASTRSGARMISDQLSGLTVNQQRRRLASLARSSNGEVRRRYLSEIQALRELRDRLRVRYCSEPRLEAATDARCQPLPGVVCGCDDCRKLGREWPGVYLLRAKRAGAVESVSYECYLHSQSEFFLHALPSSSSIVRFG